MARAACGSAFAFVSTPAQCCALPAAVPDCNNLFTTPPGVTSGLSVRTSFGGFFRGSFGKTAIRKDSRPLHRFLLPARAPFGAKLQENQSSGKESAREKKKPSRVLPSSLLDGAENKRQEKAAQAASRTDQSSENPDALRESLRQKLKHGSISHAHHSHS